MQERNGPIPTKQMGQLGHRVGNVIIWDMIPNVLLAALGHSTCGERPAWEPQGAFATHNSARVVALRDITTVSLASVYNSTRMIITRWDVSTGNATSARATCKWWSFLVNSDILWHHNIRYTSSIFKTTKGVPRKNQGECIYGRNTSNKELWDYFLCVEVD